MIHYKFGYLGLTHAMLSLPMNMGTRPSYLADGKATNRVLAELSKNPHLWEFNKWRLLKRASATLKSSEGLSIS